MNIEEVKKAIMFGGFSNDELNSLTGAFKYARSTLVQEAKRSVKVGSCVKFTNRSGITYHGIVDKIKVKYVLVRSTAGLFNVPASMLETA